MKVTDYLKREGITKTELSLWLGVNKSLVGRWEDIPEKHMATLDARLPEGIVSRDWSVREDRLHWRVKMPNGDIRVMKYGHGSEWDYEYSMGKIDFIRGLIKQLGGVGAVIEWVKPVMFPSQFIHDVHKDCVCPNVVDMRKARIEGGKPVPVRVFPFGERSNEVWKS